MQPFSSVPALELTGHPAVTPHILRSSSEPVAVSVAGAARLLGVSKRAVYAMRKAPGFPQARLLSPRTPRFLVAELIEWAAKQPAANLHNEPPQLTRGRVFKSGKQVRARTRALSPNEDRARSDLASKRP
jgi:predicted DNA-binding transcriptional regulator AlpA